MPGRADYSVSMLLAVDLLSRNAVRIVGFTTYRLGVLLKTDDNFLFFILTFLFSFFDHWFNHLGFFLGV